MSEENINEWYDFTVVSPLEGFILKLEEVFRSLLSGKRIEATKLKLSGSEYELIYKNESELLEYNEENECYDGPIIELLNNRYDFVKSDVVSSLFGVREYFVIHRIGSSNYVRSLSNETLKTIESGISVAMNNTQLDIPIFISIDESKQYYTGMCNSTYLSNYSLHFDSTLEVDSFLYYLNEVIKYFMKECNLKEREIGNLRLSCKYTYYYIPNNYTKDKEIDYEWQNVNKIKLNERNEKIIKYLEGPITIPLWGTMINPINILLVDVIWNDLKVIYEDNRRSQMDVMKSKRWLLSGNWKSNIENPLYNGLKELLKIYNQSKEKGNVLIKQLIRIKDDVIPTPIYDKNEHGSQTAAILGSTVGYLARKLILSRRQKKMKNKDGDSNNEVDNDSLLINELIKEIFQNSYLIDEENESNDIPNTKEKSRIDNLFYYIDSLPGIDSIFSLFTLRCIDLNEITLSSVCELYIEFVKKCRWYWDNSLLIPNLGIPLSEDGKNRKNLPIKPDLNNLIIYQKLQLLNCCIDLKQRLEYKNCLLERDSDGEIFEDAIDDEIGIGIKEESEIKLLKVDKKMNIPITQEEMLYTSDIIHQQETLLSGLGDSDEASKIRNQLQSIALESDMMAFKAANPGCIIEDFVRWHSPKDLIIEDDGNYHLSERMSKENNLWIQLWNKSKAESVDKQKQLFDPIKEGEKVLNYLENIKLSDLFYEILLTYFSTCLFIYENCDNESVKMKIIEDKIKETKSELIRIRNHSVTLSKEENMKEYVDLMDNYKYIEELLSKSTSLLYSFNNNKELVEKILNMSIKEDDDVEGEEYFHIKIEEEKDKKSLLKIYDFELKEDETVKIDPDYKEIIIRYKSENKVNPIYRFYLRTGESGPSVISLSEVDYET